MSLNYEPCSTTAPVEIVYGNGSSAVVEQSVELGPVKAFVCPSNDLTENLFSPNPLLDLGYTLHMDGRSGYMRHPETGDKIHVTRHGARWSVDLEDIAALKQYHYALDKALGPYMTCTLKAKSVSESVRQRVLRLHERMGHAATEVMCDACTGVGSTWSHSELTPSIIRKVMRKEPCVVCVLAKRNKKPVPDPSGERLEHLKPGEIISADIVGKINPPTKNGDCYYFLFADVKTGYQHVYTCATKSGFVTAMKLVLDWYKINKCDTKVIRTDSEEVLVHGNVGRYLAGIGIKTELSAPYAHHQNFVERYVQTANKGTSALLHGQRFLKAHHWDKALMHYIDCRNHSPNVKCGKKSPHEVITGRTTNLEKTFQFAFGDLVYVRIPDGQREWKFDLRQDIGIYVGQPPESVDSAYVYYPYSNMQYVRSNLSAMDISDEAYQRYFARRFDIRDASKTDWSMLRDVVGDLAFDFEQPSDADGEGGEHRLVARLAETEEVPRELAPTDSRATTSKSDRVLRSASAKSVTAVGTAGREVADDSAADDLFKRLCINAMAAVTSKLTVNGALRSDDCDYWIKAIRDEIFSLLYTTHSLVPEEIDYSRPHHLIHATVQLKKKMKDVGLLDKFKARCCACGNELYGLISETYSPTVSSLTHSVLHQIAIIDDMVTATVDTVAAYLNQDYPDDAVPIYLKLPRNVAEICGLNPNTVYRVKKYIYGLPDAGRAYYLAYREHLLSNGYSPTVSDPCLFTRVVDGERTYIWFHVDDTFIASSSAAGIDRFTSVMRRRFEITINEQVDAHLGVNMETLADGSIKLTQRKLLQQIFDEYPPENLPRAKGIPIPLKTPVRDIDEMGDPEVPQVEYLHLLGMLNYMTRSRPDISTALSFAATHSARPVQSHFQELLRIVRYLWDTRDKSLIVRRGSNSDSSLTLTCYVDASYLTHADSRSHSGYCMSFGKVGTFYVKSSKQQLIATSSTHAEVRALYQLIIDVIFVVNLCDELRRPVQLPAIIFEDNKPAIDVSSSLTARIKKCKHFLMLISFIREQVSEGLIAIQKVPTELNYADVLTKALAGPSFESKVDYLLGILHE
jgi:hypothetical protein